ncbi:deaminase [Gayadomonas joobiniege]|uniref:deaminase n=1 Tax=Gayadomonas joobiniege TaxID=1234606 RepID=UPI00035C47D9|nr:nucleoside deaminase [Gayadomonas joobiniege]
MNTANRQTFIDNLLATNNVAQQSMHEGHHPFAAILVGPDNRTILMTQFNIDTVNHAEATLARAAAAKYSANYLWTCTLYSTVEPCAMCAGTIYWANIGQVVFAMTEKQLFKFTGDHNENPTMDLPCRDVFKAGQKNIQVRGPYAEVEPQIAALHEKFWN